MEMSKEAGNVFGLAFGKINMAGFIYAQDGRIEKALQCGQEALQHAFQADDLVLKGGAYGSCGMALFEKGLFFEAEENLTLALEMNLKTDFVGALFPNFLWLGLLHLENGQFQKAQECCDSLLDVYERVRTTPSYARVALLMKVAAGIRGGLNPEIATVLNFDLQEIKIRFLQGIAARITGEVYLHIEDDHMDEAEAWIRKAIEVDERNRMPWDLAMAYALYAEFFKKKADPAQSKENLTKAIDLMRGCGADGWVKKYEEKMARI
jgi:tetratricopeptide (TPR) repeat protein